MYFFSPAAVQPEFLFPHKVSIQHFVQRFGFFTWHPVAQRNSSQRQSTTAIVVVVVVVVGTKDDHGLRLNNAAMSRTEDLLPAAASLFAELSAADDDCKTLPGFAPASLLSAAAPSYIPNQSINQSISLIATLRPEIRIANDMQLK